MFVGVAGAGSDHRADRTITHGSFSLPAASPRPHIAALPSYHARLRKDDMASVVRLRW